MPKWSQWAAKSQWARPEELPSNTFAEFTSEFVNLRAYLKVHPELEAPQRIAMLLEVDEKLASWPDNLPDYMMYRIIPGVVF
jgi:hypothetical protein